MRIGELHRRQQLGVVGAALAGQIRSAPALFRQPAHTANPAGRPTPPDSRLCRDALAEAHTLLSSTILAHSLRCWEFGVALAELDGLLFDPESLYVACLLHDAALGADHDPHIGCFAALGAVRAREFVLRHDGPPPMGDRIHDAIARHMDVATPIDAGTEAALLHDAAHLDVVGARSHELSQEVLTRVHTDLPRVGFASDFSRAMRIESRVRPKSIAATMWRAGMPAAIALNPLERRARGTGPVG